MRGGADLSERRGEAPAGGGGGEARLGGAEAPRAPRVPLRPPPPVPSRQSPACAAPPSGARRERLVAGEDIDAAAALIPFGFDAKSREERRRSHLEGSRCDAAEHPAEAEGSSRGKGLPARSGAEAAWSREGHPAAERKTYSDVLQIKAISPGSAEPCLRKCTQGTL